MSNRQTDSPAGYSSLQMAKILDRTPQTIRNWTEEFSEFLSLLATAGGGRPRIYNVEDLAVLYLVKEMRDQGFRTEEIIASLRQGQRGNVDPDMLSLVPHYDAESNELALEIHYLLQERDRLKNERDKALAQLEAMVTLKEENIRLQTTIQLQEKHSQERMQDIKERIDDVKDETQRQIEFLREEAEKRVEDLRRHYEEQLEQMRQMYEEYSEKLRSRAGNDEARRPEDNFPAKGQSAPRNTDKDETM